MFLKFQYLDVFRILLSDFHVLYQDKYWLFQLFAIRLSLSTTIIPSSVYFTSHLLSSLDWMDGIRCWFQFQFIFSHHSIVSLPNLLVYSRCHLLFRDDTRVSLSSIEFDHHCFCWQTYYQSCSKCDITTSLVRTYETMCSRAIIIVCYTRYWMVIWSIYFICGSYSWTSTRMDFVVFNGLEGLWSILLYIIVRSQRIDEQKRVTAVTELTKTSSVPGDENRRRRYRDDQRRRSSVRTGDIEIVQRNVRREATPVFDDLNESRTINWPVTEDDSSSL